MKFSASLQANNIGCLRSAGAVHYVELNSLVLVKGFEAFALDCGIMNENISAFVLFDETVALFSIKPFNSTFHVMLYLLSDKFMQKWNYIEYLSSL